MENAVKSSGTESAYANESARIFLRFGDHDVELSSGDTILGRGPRSTVVLDDPLVSRTHAKIAIAQGQVAVVDLGSANGVLVNGTPVEKQQTLSNGDRIVIGHQSFILLVQAGGSARS